MPIKNEIREEALKFLNENNTGVLATTFNGEPHAATIYYTVDDNFSFYFITKRHTEKYQNLVLSGRVAFVVGTGPEYTTVQARGSVEPIKNGDIEKVLEHFKKMPTLRRPKDWPLNVADVLRGKIPMIFKITPDELTFMNLDDKNYPHSQGTKHHKIIGVKK